MPALNRRWDVTIGMGSHGLPCCPHLIVGYRISGSPDVEVNGQPASRAPVDLGLHSCPHCAVNLCLAGSPDVTANRVPAHRVGDGVTELCGTGATVGGSPDVSANGGS